MHNDRLLVLLATANVETESLVASRVLCDFDRLLDDVLVGQEQKHDGILIKMCLYKHNSYQQIVIFSSVTFRSRNTIIILSRKLVFRNVSITHSNILSIISCDRVAKHEGFIVNYIFFFLVFLFQIKSLK